MPFNLNDILISEDDHERLQHMIDSRRRSRRDTDHLAALEEELGRATIVRGKELPRDVVTMNSRVRVKDLGNGNEFVYQIVFPRDADVAENRISILAPIGTGLLGYRAGATLEWPVPAGTRRLRIVAVEYQPEAANTAALGNAA